MKKKLIEYVVLIAIALGAAPVGAAVWQWSLTASNNASFDPTINWAEGMAPSSINDSARAMMARLAEFRQDISGANVLTGTSTAYVLATTAATNSGTGLCANSTALTDGQMIAFRANLTNGTAPLITVDNCSQLALQATAGTALPAGSIIGGSPYRASYNLAQNAWVLEAIYGNPYNVPLGSFLYSTISTPPNSNFVAPFGQCLSQTTYATYYAGLGSPGQGSCGSGLFPILDTRSRVLTPLDNLGGSAASRLTSSSNGCGTAFTVLGVTCANSGESQTLTTAQIPPVPFSGTTASENAAHNHNYTPVTTGAGNIGGGGAFGGPGSQTQTGTENQVHQHTFSGVISGGGTAHPIVPWNIGVYLYLRVI